ncbi:MAG: hypothetical protein IJF78_07190 [Clostridia bacterium]|nr:hypothetical protein [Clostridia bacterium]
MNAYEQYLDSLRRDLIEPLSEYIIFEKGLTWEEQQELEEFWEIHFPKSLMDFYACAFPAAERNPVVYPWNPPPKFSLFPDWRDTSPDNVTHIRELLERPVKDLVHDMKRDCWMCDNWHGLTPEEVGEAAPKLIPVFGHRYIPQSGVKPPVFSVVGRDVVYFGSDLFDYFRREFLESPSDRSPISSMLYVPVWGDIPRQMGQRISENRFPSIETFLDVFTDNPMLLNESEFLLASDPISPKQPGYCGAYMIGWLGETEKPYWIGGFDGAQDARFSSAEELMDAPVFGGKSLRERWDDIMWLSLMSIPTDEWMSLFLR